MMTSDYQSGGSSLADKVFATLENDILSGRIQVDTILSENKISASMGVSRTPVREAIRRLEQEGLVSSTSGKGIVVVGVNDSDLADIFEIRARIEGMAAARAAKLMDADMLEEMTRVVDLQEFYFIKGDADRLRDMDSAFHEMIYKYCGSRVFEEVLSSLHHRIQRYRRQSMEIAERAEHSIAEHRAILNALRERDESGAERMLVEHIENARSNLIKNSAQ